MGLFTPRQFLRPSEWLRVIPLAQEEVQKLLPLSLEKVEDHRDWCTILLRLLEAENQLEELVQVSFKSQEEQSWYPIRMSHRLYGRVQQLLYCQLLSDEDLSQVRGGPGANEFHQDLFHKNPELHCKLFRAVPPDH